MRSPRPDQRAALRGWLPTGSLWAALACGCAAEKPVPPPQIAPPAFEHAAQTPAPSWPAQDWYRGFGSVELDTLIDFAAGNNTDLAGARERVVQADARARQAGAAILPSVSGNANANYLAGHSEQGSGHETDWLAMISASYEVDFWGKNRATARAARLQADASRADRDTVALTILGGVADQYFQVLALRERANIARANRDAAQKILDAVQARFHAGVASPTELASQKAALDSAQIAITDLEQLEMQARAALAVLLGRIPENFEVEGSSLDALHEPVVAAGLPAELLTRRPDVAAAEASLRAGSANVTAARAAMLPTLALTGAAGVQNPALPAIVLTIPGVGPSFQVGANLTQPIFEHGRLQAQRDEAAARERELLAVYRSAIIAALVDVENALGALQHLEAKREFEQGSLAESERAFEGARLRYQSGSGDFLTLLEAQRTLYAARDQLTQYKLARLQALVALCKALGGGWSGAAPTTAAVR
ncbi:MAG TPA: efflux transporter outer membrane subunit [Steroidobacteraceae bacterium]|nr:efflux transporter outer membrane subunit [Steroidobacteraceae bacterium]